MLTDPAYRYWVVKQVKDPLLKNFWENEFERYGKEFLTQAIAPIQNKIGQVLLNPIIRNILGQIKSKIDMRYMMDNSKIFIANLSKGAIGEDKANLLGAILLSKFQLAAMSRSNIPEDKRVDFYLYADEFQNFSTDSFASALSEARKYRFCLILAHQYSHQLRESIRQAVYGNVGSIISFRVGGEDAEALSKEFSEEYPPRVFTELPNYEMLVKSIEDGIETTPRRASSLKPLQLNFSNRENLIRLSRQRYATSRAVIEDKIQRWLRR